MNTFLIKSEPSEYSISDLQHDKITLWDGVHNSQAINYIKSWKIGDTLLFYHSVTQKAIVGIAQVHSEPFENTADTRYSFAASISFAEILPEHEYVYLSTIKQSALFNQFPLVKQSRLSVMPCNEEFISWLSSQSHTIAHYFSKK